MNAKKKYFSDCHEDEDNKNCRKKLSKNISKSKRERTNGFN